MVAGFDFDGLAALGVWPVTVKVGQLEYQIPATPATGWVRSVADILRDDMWSSVVPGMLDGDEIDDALVSGDATWADLRAAAQDAVSAAAGMPWWCAIRLTYLYLALPRCAGELALRSVDASRTPYGAWCAAVYHVFATAASKSASKSAFERFQSALTERPEGVRAADVFDEDRAAEAFMQLHASRSS